jgi:hypothetical protein
MPLLTPAAARGQVIEACGQLSQFLAPVCQSHTGRVAGVVRVSQENAETTVAAQTSPSSFAASVRNRGHHQASAASGLSGGKVVLDDGPALRTLFTNGLSEIKALLRVRESAFLETEEVPGRFQQATAQVFVNFLGNVDGIVGGWAQIINGAFDHGFGNGGTLAGLPEHGGSVDVEMRLNFYPDAEGGFSASFGVLVQSYATAYGGAKASVALGNLSILDLATTLVFTNGIPLAASGITARLVPLYCLDLLPELQLRRADTNVILAWSGAATNYSLHCSSNLAVLSGWEPVLSAPVRTNGEFQVRLPAAERPRFYRLISPCGIP